MSSGISTHFRRDTSVWFHRSYVPLAHLRGLILCAFASLSL